MRGSCMRFAPKLKMSDRLDKIFDKLEIAAGEVVFLHSSFRRLRHFVESPAKLIGELVQRLGKSGTLIMPRYAWNIIPSARPWKGYEEYLRLLPVMNLMTTPSNIGIVPEVFRTYDCAEVSVSHFWPLTARGPAAKKLLADQETVTHAYGEGSTFSRLVQSGARVVGMGVTLNTTSLAPVADYELGDIQHKLIFTDCPVPGEVIDREGTLHNTSTVTMRAEAVQHIKPMRILAEKLEPNFDFPFFIENEVIFFSYPSNLYHDIAVAEGRKAMRGGRAVPWFDIQLN